MDDDVNSFCAQVEWIFESYICIFSQTEFTCSKSRIETLEQYVQSEQCEIRSKWTIKTPERLHVLHTPYMPYFTPYSSVSIVSFLRCNCQLGCAKTTILFMPLAVKRFF